MFGMEGLSRAVRDKLAPSTSIVIKSRSLMGFADPPQKGLSEGLPFVVLLGSVASYIHVC